MTCLLTLIAIDFHQHKFGIDDDDSSRLVMGHFWSSQIMSVTCAEQPYLQARNQHCSSRRSLVYLVNILS